MFFQNFWKLTKMNISSIKYNENFWSHYIFCLSNHCYYHHYHHTDRVIFEEDRTGLVLDQGEEADQGEHHREGHEHHQHQPRVQWPTHSDQSKLGRENKYCIFDFDLSKWTFDATGSERGIATNVISACLEPVSGLLSEVESLVSGEGRSIITSFIKHSMWGGGPSIEMGMSQKCSLTRIFII